MVTLQGITNVVNTAMMVHYEEFQELMHKQGKNFHSPLFLISVPNLPSFDQHPITETAPKHPALKVLL